MQKQLQYLQKRHFMRLGFLLILLSLLTLAGCGGNDTPVSSSFAIENQRIQESAACLEIDLNVPILSGFDSAEAINKEIRDRIG
ncbi:MAG: hypothetical protein PHC91_02625 [Eubacteriales bacterium]|nr:hypothetical protein [Eubacteriales bacterium]